MRVAYFLAILLGLCACGQKGDLYLPVDKSVSTSVQQSATPTIQQSIEVAQ